MCLLVLGAQYETTVPVLPPQVMRISMGSGSTNIKLERVVLLESRRFPDMLEQSHQTCREFDGRKYTCSKVQSQIKRLPRSI